MAKYPDIRSAAIPALHIVQREHGWCSPTAIEQAACVMRLTPAYLTAVATFYDMFSTTPKGRARRLRVHEHLVLAARRRRDLRGRCSAPPATDPDFHVKAFECLGACDIAPMASVDGEYVGPLEADGLPSDRRRREGRAARCCPTSSSSAARREEYWQETLMELLYKDLDEPGLATLDGYSRRGGYEMLRKALQMEPAGRAAGDARLGRPRPRRRRLRDGQEDVLHPQGDDGQVPRVQRRRVRARHVQGPRADAEEPASADRGDHHRRLRDRRQQVVHLHPRRVRPPGRRARRRGRRGARGRLSSASASSAPTTRSTSSCTAAPAPTSAARRPRCWTRSRASAATRA